MPRGRRCTSKVRSLTPNFRKKTFFVLWGPNHTHPEKSVLPMFVHVFVPHFRGKVDLPEEEKKARLGVRLKSTRPSYMRVTGLTEAAPTGSQAKFLLAGLCALKHALKPALIVPYSQAPVSARKAQSPRPDSPFAKQGVRSPQRPQALGRNSSSPPARTPCYWPCRESGHARGIR